MMAPDGYMLASAGVAMALIVCIITAVMHMARLYRIIERLERENARLRGEDGA